MTISTEVRKAGPFVGDGSQVSFPFQFKVFDKEDVVVNVSTGENTEETLASSSYSVALNEDQGVAPGGTVILNNALTNGKKLTIISNVPYLQPTALQNRGAFYPSVLNDSLDRLTILTQQLKELAGRHLTVPSTSVKTPQEVMSEILDIAATANRYASEALAILREAQDIQQDVNAKKASIDLSKASVDASEANVTNLAAQVNEYSDELILVAESIDAINTLDSHKDSIQAIANDLQGYPIYEFDGGEIDEENESMIGVGGVMKICADNIEDIKKVAASLEDASSLTNLAETVSEIGSTDYTGIAETGVTEA